MGIVVHGIPKWSLEFARILNINQARETGTYMGNTAQLMTNYFEEVLTVEANFEIYNETKSRMHENSKISFFLGNSPDFLAESPSHVPILFWLDAHYSGDNTSGQSSPCPVIDEINVLGSIDVHEDSLICIDDARLFSLPHDLAPQMQGWPNLQQVLSLLKEIGFCSFVCDDVIVAMRLKNYSVFCDFAMEEELWKPSALRSSRAN